MPLGGRLILALTVLAIFGTSTSLALAAPGELDTSFGAGGTARADFGGIDAATSMALQPGGKIVVAGYSSLAGPGSDFAVARFAPQGSLDSSFGVGGQTRADFGGNSDFAQAMALQPDGKIVVAGDSNAVGPSPDFAVARLTPQGVFDTGFGGGGKSIAPYASNSLDIGRAVALQPDGKILVAGWTDAFDPKLDFAVVRLLNPSGSFDSPFGADGGGQHAPFGAGTSDRGNAMALQPDGKIVLAGSSDGNFAVTRLLNPSGNFDPSFGGGTGKSLVDFGANDDAGNAMALQPDGKVVVAGVSGGNFAVARLLPGGGLDGSFAGDGRSAVHFGANDSAEAVALQPDGKIVVAGSRNIGAAGGDLTVARLQPNGLLDSTFGNGGKTIVDFGEYNTGSAVALQPDGKIVIAGPSIVGGNEDFTVARLQGDPGGIAKNAKCAGKKATIIGTNAKDRLKGTKKRDVIVALGGKDTVKGLGGNDLICGGKGKDKLLGGPGKDKLLGQAGKDILLGGPGKDKVKGGAGKDVETP